MRQPPPCSPPRETRVGPSSLEREPSAHRGTCLLPVPDGWIPELLRARQRKLRRATGAEALLDQTEPVDVVEARTLAEQDREALLQQHVAHLRRDVSARRHHEWWKVHRRAIDVQRRQRIGEVALPPPHLGDNEVHLLRLRDRDW